MILNVEKITYSDKSKVILQENINIFRIIKPYYRSRFHTAGMIDRYGLPTILLVWIVFQNRYSAISPAIEAKCTQDIRAGHPEWGAEPEKEYNVLRIESVVDVTKKS